MKRILLLSLSLFFVGFNAFSQCDELFFSEYIEGSSNNKALEIYNPMGSSVDLSKYSILLIGNGGSYTETFALYGSLGANGVFILCTDQADAAIQAKADTAMAYPSVSHFNGDDAVVLLKGTDTIDAIGERWIDPGSSWTVGTGSTKDYTLVRKATTKSPQTDWTKGVGEWDVYPQNTYSYLGSHTSDCYTPTKPEVGFAKSFVKVNETDGTITVDVSISNPSSTKATTVDVVVTGGDAANGTDFNSTSPMTLTFAAGSGSNETYSITLVDNSTSSKDKTIELTLRNISADADLSADSMMTVSIENDDYLVAKIKDVRGNTVDFTPELEDQKVEVTGIVYGIDYDGNAGISFTIIDSTAGINIFNFNDVSDYVVTEGDEITVRGKIDFYNGLTEVFADSIKVNSTGNTLKDPVVVAAPSESTESDFIKVRKIWIADTTTVWPDNGNVLVTNGTDTFQVRVDRDVTDMVGQPVAHDTMDIVGIGGQYDNSGYPLDAGYQIFPRSINDVMEWDRTGVREFTLETRIFPNPSNGNITVFAKSPVTGITLTDISGKAIMSFTVNHSLSTSLKLPEVTPGIYLIRVDGESASGISKLIIE